ncbi:MAG TPA: hypothetical protein DCL77_10000 [Prolixibacteraceae bacterium]|jgi:hypothetical protein|nr:hypothetical protein [Prolixibacteraceae bacterium]
MEYSVKINNIKTLDELEGSWTNADYIELLKRFDYADAKKLQPSELKAYLFMAISDFEPSDAAAIVLNYKLSEILADGQTENLSHEILREKVSENYSDITIHKTLFTINQLLYKAYNGHFPATRATVVEFEMKEEPDQQTEVTRELALKALCSGLSDKNLINRLFKDQLQGNVAFAEADGIVWELQPTGNDQYKLTTSEKWLTREDIKDFEFESTVIPFTEKVEKE